MSVQKVSYKGGNIPAVGFSKGIWADCPIDQIIREPGLGVYWFDDFLHLQASTYPYLRVEADDNASIALQVDTYGAASTVGGILRLALAADDNEEAYMGLSQGTSGMGLLGMVPSSYNTGQKMWFEARIRPSAIATASYLIGMIGVDKDNGGAEVAADLMADTQTDAAILATSTPSFIGFLTAGDTDADAIDAIYMTEAASAHTTHKNVAAALTASGWLKIGWRYDGDRYLQYYVNNAKVGDPLDRATSGFPDGVMLAPVIGVKNAANQATNLDMDWWGFAQLR